MIKIHAGLFKLLLGGAVLFTLIFAGPTGCSELYNLFPAMHPDLEQGRVTRVIDGDTAHIRFNDGSEEKVRFIGVDAPEINHPTAGVEPFGPEAAEFAIQLLDGQKVWLEYDQGLRDQYDRLLAYIWLENPENFSDAEIRDKMYNARLLIDGYAVQVIFEPNVRYVDYFALYESEAREAKRGLWAD